MGAVATQKLCVMEREHDGHTPGQGRNSARIEVAVVEIYDSERYRDDGRQLKYLTGPGILKIFQS